MSSIRTVNSLLSCKLNFIRKKKTADKKWYRFEYTCKVLSIGELGHQYVRSTNPEVESSFFQSFRSSPIPFAPFDFCSRPLAVTVEQSKQRKKNHLCGFLMCRDIGKVFILDVIKICSQTLITQHIGRYFCSVFNVQMK